MKLRDLVCMSTYRNCYLNSMLNIFEKANKEYTCSLYKFEDLSDFKCKWVILLGVFEV